MTRRYRRIHWWCYLLDKRFKRVLEHTMQIKANIYHFIQITHSRTLGRHFRWLLWGIDWGTQCWARMFTLSHICPNVCRSTIIRLWLEVCISAMDIIRKVITFIHNFVYFYFATRNVGLIEWIIYWRTSLQGRIWSNWSACSRNIRRIRRRRDWRCCRRWCGWIRSRLGSWRGARWFGWLWRLYDIER